jgi:hypothetical protein
MLISVHMPKTAGSSFRATLAETFGERLLADYGDYPLAAPPAERHVRALEHALAVRPDHLLSRSCVHGHFLPVKYLPLADAMPCRFVTWLRDPVDRLVSHYDYWHRSYDPQASNTSSLHRRVVEEGWDLERFCTAPELRNVYSAFLWAFPLRYFDFVGISECYAEDLCEFSAKFLGTNVVPQSLNRSERQRGATDLPVALRRRVRAFHASDVQLYEWALRRRSERRAGRH